MGEESNTYYLVRKGDMIGIYKSLRDCQAQAGSSVSDPSISVYKGYGLPKEAEDFLRSHGLKKASYSISVNDVKDNLYGKLGQLVACPYQQPVPSKEEVPDEDSSPERWQEAIDLLEVAERAGWPSIPTVSSTRDSCILEFDGASKGNPGQAGAGAVLRAEDGTVVWQLREGVGIATNNVAEYRALLLGLTCALNKGFKHICVQGDSKLVVMQVQDLWKTKNPNMANLCKQAKELKEKFISFQINHVLREFNIDADVQANRAINLKDGQVEEDYKKM